MPTSADRAALLVDTSAAVALVVADHPGRHAVKAATRGRTPGLAGHAAFETYSVLTRLPPPARRSPSEVSTLIQRNFAPTRFLDVNSQRDVLRRLASAGITGGSVYDALVAAVAAQHRLPLMTRDRRAVDIYRAFNVEVEFVD